uniref:Uncharacterized protein n=1 Tax=Arcella intermedia TaxID=1963864 RepID=A0A6B2LQV2_9EUKA
MPGRWGGLGGTEGLLGTAGLVGAAGDGRTGWLARGVGEDLAGPELKDCDAWGLAEAGLGGVGLPRLGTGGGACPCAGWAPCDVDLTGPDTTGSGQSLGPAKGIVGDCAFGFGFPTKEANGFE